VEESLEFALLIDHPYSIAYALYHNGYLALGRSHFDEALIRARELATIASEHDYPLWRTLATVLEGVATAALGEPEKGLALTEVGIELYQGLSAPPIFWPSLLQLRATVHAMAGDPARALELIDEALGTDSAELSDPDLVLSKADFLTMLPDSSEAEAHYLRAIGDAHDRGTRLVELRARTHLAAWRRARSLPSDGIEELAALLRTFDTGLSEIAVVEARAILGQPVDV
jgi:tetratricopeptide (TPR) repeat protein